MNPKKIEFRKRTRKQAHLVEKTIGVVAIVALIVLVGALLMETSWTEEIFSSRSDGGLLTGAAVEGSPVANEVIVPEQITEPPVGTAIAPEEPVIGIQAGGGGEIGILGDANSTSCGNVTGSLTLTANITTTTNCFTINVSNIVLDCAGFTVSGDGGSSDSGILNSDGYDNITITNCTFDNFNEGIYSYNNAYSHIIQYNTFTNLTYGVRFGKPFTGTANGTIWNNTFSLPKTSTSYAIGAANSNNIFNNTFRGDYSVGGINVDDNNQIWGNYFWGSDGTYSYGNSSLCVNGIGNFYNGSVDVAQVPAADCGPTPNQAVYVNQSRGASSFTFGGRDATYPDLRTAVYNTWNGTNNIIYLLENHNTSYSQSVWGQGTSAVHFIRSNVSLNCLGYTYSDTTGDSSIAALSTYGSNDITIHNCTISNFDTGVYIYGSQRTIVFNNTFAPGTDANEYYGITLTNGDNSTITNNTFTGDFTSYAMSVGSTSTDNNISQNQFLGSDGISDSGNNNLCVNSVGNFYNATVAVAAGSVGDQVPAHDCGPTPNGTVYVNQSAGAVSFTWGGASAVYPDLRTAVYNTWNGTNNTIYLLEDHNTSYSQGGRAVHFMRSGLDINCLGHTYSDADATSDIYGFTTHSKSNIDIYNCVIYNFNSALLLSSGTNYRIYNNSFVSGGEYGGIYLSNADNSIITNNTFSEDYTVDAIDLDSNSANNNVSQNQFWGGEGIDDRGSNNSICVNGIGNFYNASVALAYVYPIDCGPTPNGAVYVNQSATTSFTWNGTSAIYPDLRTAVYNTWNGANNTVYFLGNHSTSYSQSSRAVHFVRNNITVNCRGYTYSDPTASSAISGFDTNGFNETIITNCTISNFDEGIIINNGDRLIIANNLFEAGGENEGIYFFDGDFINITNNTFTGDYVNFAIDSDNSGPNNTNIWQNQFLGNEGIGTPIGANDYFCVNGIGNYYNSTVAIAQVPTADCGPTPNSNVSTNSSLSASSWSFSTSAIANPVYKNLQEAYYNLQENRTLFLLENYSTTSTTQTIRNGTTLDCQNKRINSTADAININGEVGTTVSNCVITTTGNGIEGITLTSSATGNTIVNTRINTTGTTAYGVTFTSSNGNNIINSTFNIPLAKDVYSSTANNNSIINSIFNRSDLGFTGTGSWIQVKWYVNVNVTNGTVPLVNATVNIANVTSTNIFNGLTDVNGQIPQQTLTEFWQNGSLTVYETPHNVSGNKTGYATNFTLVNLTQTNSTTVILNLAAEARDITPPRWEANSTAIVSTYSSTQSSLFNITWTDDVNISTVWFESNYSGTAINYSMNRIAGNSTNGTYNYSSVLPAGAFYWKSYANDSSNQWNNTDTWTFTIARASSSINLTLNGTGSNITLLNGTAINLNCSRLTGEGNVELYLNGTLINSGTNIGNLTNFTAVGLQNATCLYPQTQNYSASSAVYWINVTALEYSDLKINNSDITYTSGTIKHNDLVEINATVYNLGNTNATNANLSFYVDSALNQSRLVNLSFGSSQLISFNWTATGGNHTLEIKADPANALMESNETNNNATQNIPVKYVAVLQYLSPTGSFPRGKDVAGEDALLEISNTLTALAQVYDLYNNSHALFANCSFYFNETLIGTNSTNSSGYCSYTFDKTIYSYGWYNLTVNFTGIQSDAVQHTSQIQNTTPIGIIVFSTGLTTVNHYGGLNYELGEMAVLNISITQNGTAYSPDAITPTIRGATDPADGPSVYASTMYNDSIGKYHYASLITSSPNGDAVKWRVRINSTALGLIGTASHSDVIVNPNGGNLSMGIINSTQNNFIGTQLTVKDAAAYTLNQSINTSITNYPIRKDKNHTLEFVASSGEMVMLQNVNLNQTNNNLTLQVVAAYNGTLPAPLKNFTSVAGFESFPYNVTNGNITLPKNGKIVTSILRCSSWNSATAICAGNWSTYTTTFGENSTHLWFNITSFSGYAGGVLFSSNLTIWDEVDSGMPWGNKIKYENQQVLFFTNYTNSSSGAVIAGASCNISFNTAPNGPFNMSYNSTYSLYTYNRSFSSAGTYAWNVTCTNSTYDTLTANDAVVISATAPTPSPGGGGGGPSCTSSWNCTEWSKCSLSLKQIKICVDQNGCEEDYTEEQDCAKCQEAWVCSAWSECKNEIQTRICKDYNDCGTIEQRPEQVKSCGIEKEEGEELTPKPEGGGEEEEIPVSPPEEEVPSEIIGPLIGKAFLSKATLKIAWERYAYYLLGLFLLTMLVILLLVLIKRRSKEKDPLKELKNWIWEEKQRGLSDSQIMVILLQHTTWSKEEIAQAFYEVKHPEIKPKR